MNAIERVKKLNEKYHFMNTVAKNLNTEQKGKLSEYTISVKDNICVKDMQSTAGSMILEGYIPPYDATVIIKCRAEARAPAK
jgi:aspartyl-tRNA(Asn)/glutamyl-tRNA(Gln) amidotransferase subunit A